MQIYNEVAYLVSDDLKGKGDWSFLSRVGILTFGGGPTRCSETYNNVWDGFP
ncbi:MAG: hypothetical protein CM15mP49_33100 [Actinomycetota bacterium]|nr:MAG: hypothetical protein CM15mP49_33100 [Actinomycetota bacterium]